MSKKTLGIIVIIFVIIILVMIIGGFSFLRSTDEGGGEESGLRDFFPFGRGDNGGGEERPPLPDGPRDEVITDDDIDTTGGRPAGVLRQLTNEPVAGATSITSGQNRIVVRYIERATGNVYEIDPLNLNKTRLTNTTIPAVREAFFDGSGEELHLRYLNENEVIKTFAANILAPGETLEKDEDIESNGVVDADKGSADTPPSAEGPQAGGTSGRIAGAFLEDDILFETPSPDKDRIFYLMPFGTSMVGIMANFDDSDKEQIFSSPHFEWLPAWPTAETIALTTKASGTADGFLYFLDIKTEAVGRVLGDILGLTTLVNSDTTKVLYSQSGEGRFTSHLLSTENRATTRFALTTLPEKCVWSRESTAVVYCGVPGNISNNLYPDVWYQGLVSFSDTIWKVDVDTNTTELLSTPTKVAGEEIDLTQPFLSKNENYLFFINKKDSTLWSLKLE